MPGIYAVTSMPFDRRTRAIFRSAEFGFFGVMVVTFTHTPRLNAEPRESSVFLRWSVSRVNCIAGDLDFTLSVLRPRRMSWFIVGINKKSVCLYMSVTTISRAHTGVKSREGRRREFRT